MAERVSVMIVDDQPPFREAARAVLSRIDGFELVAEVASGEEAVSTSGELHPDLVLMDINMGELDGIEATRLITDAHPATKVILVSTYSLDDLPVDGPLERGDRLRQQGRAVPAWYAASGRPAATPPGSRPIRVFDAVRVSGVRTAGRPALGWIRLGVARSR